MLRLGGLMIDDAWIIDDLADGNLDLGFYLG